MKKFSNSTRGLVLASALLLFYALVFLSIARLQVHAAPNATQPPLGTASNFAVLGGSAVTNTGPTIVNGDLGVSPGSAVTGFPPGIVNGTIHAADAVAAQAQSDVTTAYVNAAGQPCNVSLTGQDLGSKTLTSGVYCFTSSAQLTGPLTLDGQGNPASVFIFQIGSTLTTASNATVLLTNGAQACNVFWQIGSSATVGTNTSFAGNILALTSISFTTGAVSNGSLYARNGAVTLDTNTITRSPCTNGTPTATPTSTSTATPTSAPDLSITNENDSGGHLFHVGDRVTYMLTVTNAETAGPIVSPNPIMVSDIIPIGEMDLHAFGSGWRFTISSTTSPAVVMATFIGPFPVGPGESLPPITITAILTKEAIPSITTTAIVNTSANSGENGTATSTIFVEEQQNNQRCNNNNQNDSNCNNNENSSSNDNNNENSSSNYNNNSNNNNSHGTNSNRNGTPGMPFTGSDPTSHLLAYVQV